MRNLNYGDSQDGLQVYSFVDCIAMSISYLWGSKWILNVSSHYSFTSYH